MVVGKYKLKDMAISFIKITKLLGINVYLSLFITACLPALAQTNTERNAIGIEDKKEAKEPNVTAVYGIVADDYLPPEITVTEELDPQRVGHKIRPSFDLPDIFYIVGVPVFFFLFFRILITFLK